MPGLIERALRHLPGRRRNAPDPFLTLELQTRLGRLSAELDALAHERVPRFAIAHHAEAATRAYEMTLAEACRLMGLEVPADADRPARLLMMEADLIRVGWSW